MRHDWGLGLGIRCDRCGLQREWRSEGPSIYLHPATRKWVNRPLPCHNRPPCQRLLYSGPISHYCGRPSLYRDREACEWQCSRHVRRKQ